MIANKDDIMVSIVVAVYNVEKYLTKCIESLVRQTYSNIEIILIDDGSTDNSSSICDEWAKIDSRIVVYHQENKGVAVSRNKGILCALGVYVIFVDSDDWVENTFVEKLLQYHHKDEWTLVGYYIDYEQVNKNRQIKKLYKNKESCQVKKEEVASLFRMGLFGATWNKLYEISRIKNNNIKFREDMDLGEDIVFNLEYLKHFNGNFYIINELLYHYIRRNRDSLMVRFNERYVEMNKIAYTEFLAYLNSVSADEESRRQILASYFDVLVTAMDNLYMNRKSMNQKLYAAKMTERKKERELKNILNQMEGKIKIIYSIRYLLVSHGFWIVDYHLRKVMKKILALE